MEHLNDKMCRDYHALVLNYYKGLDIGKYRMLSIIISNASSGYYQGLVPPKFCERAYLRRQTRVPSKFVVRGDLAAIKLQTDARYICSYVI